MCAEMFVRALHMLSVRKTGEEFLRDFAESWFRRAIFCRCYCFDRFQLELGGDDGYLKGFGSLPSYGSSEVPDFSIRKWLEC